MTGFTLVGSDLEIIEDGCLEASCSPDSLESISIQDDCTALSSLDSTALSFQRVVT